MKTKNDKIIRTPWDQRSLLVDTYEIICLEESRLKEIETIPGHYTVKIDPLSEKKGLLYKYGFYYCDTLIEPCVNQKNYKSYFDNHVSVKITHDLDAIQEDISGIFQFDRFHRDFNIEKGKADQRYKNWLKQLGENNTLYLLKYKDNYAGFIACKENHLVLHALAQNYQGKGLSKYFWSLVCNILFEQGYLEITSSISAANLAVLNLYISLGFKFRCAQDIYHKLIKEN